MSSVVVWIEDFSDGELVEAEVAFYAQDNDGNVWFLGEYPEEYEEGEVVSALTWISGIRSAKAGVVMWAKPSLEMSSYAQGWGPEIHWNDRAQIVDLMAQTCVPVDCYESVLITEEFNQDEPDAYQVKYYAAGVGNVRVGWRGEDAQPEELELVEHILLDPVALAAVRAEALTLEKSAYITSRGVYLHTPPAQTAVEIALENSFEHFDPANFDQRSINIDNQWLPLLPGNHWAYEGSTNDEGTRIHHRIEFTVTDLTKEIQGITTAVAYIEDFADGKLVEAEIAFYAQDKEGNVWYLGEYPEEYEDGIFVAAPTWIAGILDSKPGVKMYVDPQMATPSYSQGLALSVEWTDRGQVFQKEQETCVAFDCYENVLIIDEFNLEEPGIYQVKYYAPEVGNIRVDWRGRDLQQEELELVDFTQLDPEALAEVRAAALALEAHAYEVSPEVYGHTSPSE